MPSPVDLSTLSAESPATAATVAETIALGEAELRKDIARKITSLFTTVNLVVIGIIAVLALFDDVNVRHKFIAPADRIVDYRILAAIIAATTVQLGSIAFIMAKYVFPPKAGGD